MTSATNQQQLLCCCWECNCNTIAIMQSFSHTCSKAEGVGGAVEEKQEARSTTSGRPSFPSPSLFHAGLSPLTSSHTLKSALPFCSKPTPPALVAASSLWLFSWCHNKLVVSFDKVRCDVSVPVGGDCVPLM